MKLFWTEWRCDHRTTNILFTCRELHVFMPSYRRPYGLTGAGPTSVENGKETCRHCDVKGTVSTQRDTAADDASTRTVHLFHSTYLKQKIWKPICMLCLDATAVWPVAWSFSAPATLTHNNEPTWLPMQSDMPRSQAQYQGTSSSGHAYEHVHHEATKQSFASTKSLNFWIVMNFKTRGSQGLLLH